jgi:tetratricopeptide (TPR) repeat protein
MFRPALLAACTFVLIASTTHVQAQESWAGKKVLTKKGDIKIGHTDAKGRHVYDGKIDDAVVTVLADQGGWLKVRQQGVEGWFDKADAILLENAIPYFTDQIRANSNDSYAYIQRGIAWAEKREYDIAIKDYSEALRLNPTKSLSEKPLRAITW